MEDWTLPELARAFVDFRDETRDEIKWVRRLLVGLIISALGSSIISSVFLLLTRVGR